jgi:4-aminobutyrate aminotransferase/diaminobutyrate-pyruvate transaminase/4-aminobutyrate aminotransferase/(S)-3-amino-2-methylpropionate transaminase
MWGFEHYGIIPDLAALGKGISGSMPLAALAGSALVMDLHPPGSMSSTHSGNPVCCAAALASIDVILEEGLIGNSVRLGSVLTERLREIGRKHRAFGNFDGRGLVAAINIVKPGSKEPDAALAHDIVRRSMEKGLLMFSPVGFGGATIKICPPLSITEEALREGLDVFAEAFTVAVSG